MIFFFRAEIGIKYKHKISTVSKVKKNRRIMTRNIVLSQPYFRCRCRFFSSIEIVCRRLVAATCSAWPSSRARSVT